MTRKKTHAEFVKEFENRFGKDEYEFLSEYDGVGNTITLTHKKCGYKWSPTASHLLKSPFKNGTCCQMCNKTIPMNLEIFKAKVRDLVGEEYIVLGDYKNITTKIKIKHNITECNYEYHVSPNNFINLDNRCPKCNGNAKKNTEEFRQEVFELTGDEYKVLGEYVKSDVKISIRHNASYCQHEYMVTPNHFINGTRCPKCYKNNNVNESNFKEKLYEKYGNEIIPLDEYKGSDVKIRFKHCKDDCNSIFYRTPTHIINEGRTCDCLKIKSKSEDVIEEFLVNNNIKFNSQITFNECKYKYVLPYDFGIFDDNYKLQFLIEYDGEQHFKPIRFGGMSISESKIKFKEGKMRDNIKNKYCIDNNIKLIRIPYWENERLEEILCHYLIEPIDNFRGSFLIS